MITVTRWKQLCYTLIVLLLPYLMTAVVNGHWWVTVTIWVVGLLWVWWPRRNHP